MGDALGQSELKKEIQEAVSMAIVQEKLKDHDRRIRGLEGFRWWLVGGVAASALGSWGTLIIFLVEKAMK